MKNIQDCIDKEVAIICNSFEEYKGIKTLLKEDKDPLKHYYEANVDKYGKVLYSFNSPRGTRGTIRICDLQPHEYDSVYQASEFLYREEFPEKWYFKNDYSDKVKSVIISYFNEIFKVGYTGNSDYYYFENYELGATDNESKIKGLTELSIDEICYLISKQANPMAGEKRETRKIIGYKCPYDILHWNKGDIFKVWERKIGYYYVPGTTDLLPKELVETWEPVYENDKIIVPGSSYEVVIVSKSLTTIDGYDFPRSFWAAAHEVSKHSKAQVRIVCSHQFTIDQKWIESVLDAMERK